MALCPGLIDTDASRPWFEDMSRAQTPARRRRGRSNSPSPATFDPAFYGELVQFGKVLPWESGVPVAHRATAYGLTRRAARQTRRGEPQVLASWARMAPSGCLRVLMVT